MSVYRHDPCNFGFAREWGTSVVVTNNSTNIFFILIIIINGKHII